MRAGRRHACVSLTLLVACSLIGLTPMAEATDDRTALTVATSGEAEAALTMVRSLLSPSGSRPAGRPVPATTSEDDLTLALRDLALLRSDLAPEHQEAAAAYLSRPTDGGGDHNGSGYTTTEAAPVCSPVVCVHYVTSTADAVDPTDTSPANGVPDQAELALATATDVHRTYVGAGYRAPLGDGVLGGNAKPDLYLADIGRNGLYGYCASDQSPPPAGPFTAWAFCVLDNDYDAAQYPRTGPRETLEVTTAHEYFHAVQFGYDMSADSWFLEATATWAEDEVYDDVDDNVQFLTSSPLSHPHRSMDQFSGGFHYGAWIFFRHLTERFPAGSGGMPTLVRDMIRRTDDARGGHNEYSLQAVSRVVAQRGTSLGAAFARFTVANTRPQHFYDEAAANRYPRAHPEVRLRIRRGTRAAEPVEARLDHLASTTMRYLPRAGLTGKRWRLRLAFDLPRRVTKAAARVSVVTRRGLDVRRVRLDRHGDGRIRVPFSRGRVRHVAVTLVNASGRFRCQRATRFSCGGQPRDDGLPFGVRARAVRTR